MTLPIFTPQEDPGPSFFGLLQKVGIPEMVSEKISNDISITHGTTIVAIRYEGGVLMAGDRRATSGHLISHRTMEKVFPADAFSGVGISGAAGPAMEMVRLFQLQLEHYEKVEGSPLSLEGKANQLSLMLKGNFPAAMQGLGVIPIFAGYEEKTGEGRLFQFDITGGRYEEKDFVATGSGSLHAATVIKLRHSSAVELSEAIDIALEALLEASEEDSATGGPDLLRGIFPVVAKIDSNGFDRISDDDLAGRTEIMLQNISQRGSS
ncbi:MAG: proteasome subunit beta [Acidimicrobiales bacterium]|nr:proteasome subunit beta [Acidimicrobiales bacterium]